MVYRKGQRIYLIILLYLGMAYSGILNGLKSVTLPLIKNDFGISYDGQGLMMLVLTATGALSSYVGIKLYKKFGAKVSFFVAFAVGIILQLLIGAAPFYFLVVIGMAMMKLSANFYEMSKNVVANRVFITKIAASMTLLHCVYGIGNILCTKAVQWLIDTAGFTWRGVYLLAIIPTAIIGVMCLLADFNCSNGAEKIEETTMDNQLTFKKAFSMRPVWLFAIAISMSGIVEDSFSNWSLLYLQDVFGLDPVSFGTTFLSVFFIIFTVSRLTTGFAVEKIGYVRSLVIGSVLIILIFTASFVIGVKGVWLLPAAGFMIAMYVPTQLATMMRAYGSNAAVMISAATIIQFLLMAGFQYLIGFTSDVFGDAWGFRSTVVYAFIFIVAICFYLKDIKSEGYTDRFKE